MTKARSEKKANSKNRGENVPRDLVKTLSRSNGTLVTAFKAAAVENFFFAYFIETEMTINENKRRGDLGKPVAQNFFLLSSFRFVVANLILLINYNFFLPVAAPTKSV